MGDSTYICRTCLAEFKSTSVKFYKLEAPSMWPKDAKPAAGGAHDSSDNEIKSSLLECLRFCTRLDDHRKFPAYICADCRQALHIAYYFIQNATKAHDILVKRGLCDMKEEQCETSEVTVTEQTTPIKYRCKLCGEKMSTKRALKEHVKFHMDVITYCCQLCDFDCKKRFLLNDHYLCEHNVEATSEQLKPFMQPNANSETVKPVLKEEEDLFEFQDISKQQQLEEEQQEAERHLQELEEQMLKEKQQKEQERQLHDEEEKLRQAAESTSLTKNKFTAVASNNISETFSNEISVGNEFIVLPDGTVEKVIGTDVVIEYINREALDSDGIASTDSGLVADGLPQIAGDDETGLAPMTFDDIIEEALSETTDAPAENSYGIMNSFQMESQNAAGIAQPSNLASKPIVQVEKSRTIKSVCTAESISRRTRCKICSLNFKTQPQLKIHMLTHDEIPHFFCMRCPFYTFFKNDLVQHYRAKHNLQPSNRQLQPKNNPDSIEGKAIYSCDLCLYESTSRWNLRRHYLNEHCVNATEVQLRPTLDHTDVDIQRTSKTTRKPTLDNLTCKICQKVFLWPHKYKEHQRSHVEEQKRQAVVQLTQNVNVTERMDIESECIPTISATISNTNRKNNNNNSNRNKNNSNMLQPNVAIPQVVESEQTIEQVIDFDFNGDAFFEDFDDNTNDSNDKDELGDLALTSEDDLDDLLKEHGNGLSNEPNNKTTQQLRAYCIHCNKRFFSQYHFENHMFVHRGLAPYRCEMCTNLYNTKRALIRHYKAVHKRMPTRDMIQAKGDKVDVDRTPIEHINLEEQKARTLMCAKCPYESTDVVNLQIHLRNSHGITDELPFECPRCIRSYETKSRLIKHLERSHSVSTITQQQQQQQQRHTTMAANITTTASSPYTILNNMTTTNAWTVGSRSETTEQWQQNQQQQQQQQEQESDLDHNITNIIKNCQIIETTSAPLCSIKPNLDVAVSLGTKKILDHEKSITYECSAASSIRCSVCQGNYKSQALLNHHMKRHMSRKYRCSLCPKTYISRTELNKHKLLHTGHMTGEMPHKCDLCDKQFGYAHHLKRHKEVTHDGKRYSCAVCGNSFTTKSQLNLHDRIHSGRLPYKCKFCNQYFNKRELLRQHTRKLHRIDLTETEIAEIFRATTGYTNPHDLTVAAENGQMLRRLEIELMQYKMESINQEYCNTKNDTYA